MTIFSAPDSPKPPRKPRAPRKPARSRSTEEAYAKAFEQEANSIENQWSSARDARDALALHAAATRMAAWNKGAYQRRTLAHAELRLFDLDDLLRIACSKNHSEALAPLVANGAWLDRATRLRTPMAHAAAMGSLDAISTLVALGADPNKGADVPTPLRDKHSFTLETPLMAAAFAGHIDAMALLLSLGARLDQQDSSGHAALHWAATSGDSVGVAWLLARGACPTLANKESHTPLMLAAIKGHGLATTLLAQANPELIELRDGKGNRPAHLAAEASRPGAILALAREGANFSAKNAMGHTAHQLALVKHADAARAVLALSEHHALSGLDTRALPKSNRPRI